MSEKSFRDRPNRRHRFTRALSIAILAFSSWGCASLSASHEPTYRTLQSVITNDHVSSVADLLARLPATYRSHHVLLFLSRSPQGASFGNPRAVVYGADASLVLAFNGSPEEAGFEALDTMEFDPARGEFVFRQISFPENAGDSRPRFSEDNPASCSACHGVPLRPIWDAYPSWPGAYGERAGMAMFENERRGLAAFEAGRRSNPRYRALPDRTLGPAEARALAYEGEAVARPNAELGELFARQSAEAIVRDVLGSPRIRDYRYALLASLVGACSGVETIPDGTAASFGETYGEFATEVRHAYERQEELKGFRSLSAAPPAAAEFGGRDNPLALSRFRYVAEKGMALTSEPWSSAFERAAYDRPAPGFASLFVARASERDPELGRLFEEAGHGDCRELQRRSLARLRRAAAPRSNDVRARVAPEAAPPPKAVVARERSLAELLSVCIGCHRDGPGPSIPFGDLAAFRLTRGPRGSSHGSLLSEIACRLRPDAGARRMPLGTTLSEQEVETLEAYFGTSMGGDGDDPEGARSDGPQHPDQRIVTTWASGGTCD